MKKIFLIATLALLSFTGLYANNNDGTKVNTEVTNAFNQHFKNASNIKWSKIQEVFIAYFSQNNEELIAYFNENGELLATGRDINSRYLPLTVSMAVAEKYHGYNLVQSLEYASRTDGTSYIIYLGNEKKNRIVRVFIDGTIEKLK